MLGTPLITDQKQINRLMIVSSYFASGYVSSKSLGALYHLAIEDQLETPFVIWSLRIDMSTITQEAVGFATLGDARSYAEAASQWARMESQPYAFLAYCLCTPANWDKATVEV